MGFPCINLMTPSQKQNLSEFQCDFFEGVWVLQKITPSVPQGNKHAGKNIKKKSNDGKPALNGIKNHRTV